MRLWFSIGTLVFAVAFTGYGLYSLALYDFNGRPGPGFFPLLIGAGLVLSTSVNVVKDAKAWLANRQVAQVEAKAIEKGTFYRQDTLVIAGLIAALILLLNGLGAILAMVLFMLGFLFYFNPGKWSQNFIYAIGFPLAVYTLFDVWLQAGLPGGLLDQLARVGG